MQPMDKRFSHASLDANGALQSFSIECPAHFNFGYDVVDCIAETEPDRTALVWCNPAGETRTFTFGQMRDLSNQCANFLLGKGVKKGDRVMLILKRHYEYWYAVLALHKIGAVAVPATYMLTPEDILYRVRTANIHTIICAEDEDILAHVASAYKACDTLQNILNVRADRMPFVRLDTGMQQEPKTLSRISTDASDPFLLYFTSGTTGYPKAVVHDYRYPLAHIVTAKYWQNVQPGGLHLTVADTGWGKASWGKLYGQWLCGCAVMVYDFDRFQAAELTRVIREYRVTSFCAPPTIYRFLVKNGLNGSDFASVRDVTTAGEALNPEIIQQFYEITGLEIREGYGQTETTLLIGNLAHQPARRGAMGMPSPLYHVQLAGEDGKPVPPGVAGEIVVLPSAGPSFGLSIGYDNDAAAGERAWRDGVYHTGDMAYYDADGYYWYIGRTDDIIKSSGYRIGPFEVENVLIRHPAVLECAVTGVPDPERGYVVKATVVLRTGYTPSDDLARELQQFVKAQTAPYKYPRIVQFVDALPKTISGKIKRGAIRASGGTPENTATA